jgi:hypothetical protein
MLYSYLRLGLQSCFFIVDFRPTFCVHLPISPIRAICLAHSKIVLETLGNE